MSRIGRKPVVVPSGVEVVVSDAVLRVKGAKGSVERHVMEGISFNRDGDTITVERAGNSPKQRAAHGMMRALLNNMVVGVSAGFTKRLKVIGVGYKAEVQGKKLVLNLGYSHMINYPFPDGITISIDKGDKSTIEVSGVDKEQVGQVAAELRGFRPPDSYKGKGVRYEGEYVRLKAGKSGK